MKQAKISFLVVVLLFASVLVSCVPGGAQAARGWSGTAFHDGIVYAGSADGRVVAVDAATGSLKWHYPITAPSGGGLSCGPAAVSAAIYTTPIVEGDLVYVGTYTAQGGRMYALRISDGQIIWEYPRGGAYIGAIVGTPVIAGESIYFSSSDGRVYALDRSSFTLDWSSEQLADKLWTSPAVVGDTVYVSTLDGHIHALSAETGEPLDWSFESQTGFASAPVVYEDIIYVGSFDNNLYAVRIGASEPLWRFAGGKWFWAAPLVSHGIVYAGCLDGRIYAIDAETGEGLWQFESKDAKGRRVPIVSSPYLVDNLLILVNEAGTVHVFDLGDDPVAEPAALKTISIGADVRGSFSAHEGLVYIRDEKNRLNAVDIDRGVVDWMIPLTGEE
ncbi:MAG: PQQ-binding-like beta-propeller repeat protein [Dehalococcoidia bacterium]|nr:PQQ-binding-like beta-propeller repeat protein [Dehalococcoidia bacterium]